MPPKEEFRGLPPLDIIRDCVRADAERERRNWLVRTGGKQEPPKSFVRLWRRRSIIGAVEMYREALEGLNDIPVLEDDTSF